ncbi:hypothetical protein [uncultured Subdoligranulum sp.]|uniref:hypothetical protein n=1 Tax=uncultured Subdoligranulum sp. TaxID=512298 RepID=UPI002631B7C0|nr:hypothetical protein [uncultured Subdoligranulum sp.]
MATIEQVKNGISRYLDQELMPNLSDEKPILFAVGAFSALLLNNVDKAILKYGESPVVKMTGIIDDNQNIDVDALAEVAKQSMKKYAFSLDDFLVGKFSFLRGHVNTIDFTPEDIDTLKRYIKGE